MWQDPDFRHGALDPLFEKPALAQPCRHLARRIMSVRTALLPAHLAVDVMLPLILSHGLAIGATRYAQMRQDSPRRTLVELR